MSDKQENGWRRYVSTDRILAVLAIVLGIAFSREARGDVAALAHWTTVPIIAGLFAILLYGAYRLGERAEKAKQTSPEKKEDSLRWEALGEIKYGHLKYYPFLDYNDDQPTGLAIKILAKLLTIDQEKNALTRVGFHGQSSNWENVFDRLKKGEFDVIATPVFATFERSKSVRFSSPLFFSNVGLYVSRRAKATHAWDDITVDNLAFKLSDPSFQRKLGRKLRFLAVKGEISADLANKYAGGNPIEFMSGDVLPSSLFSIIAEREETYHAFFCESFTAFRVADIMRKSLLKNPDQANAGSFNGDEFNPPFVNVLGSEKILYPVCFAVRISDHHLANLLNIRLLAEYKDLLLDEDTHGEAPAKDGEGPKSLVAQLVSATGLSKEQIKEHFVMEWPIKNLEKGKPKEIEAHA